jgi:23S rRNA pseudouridine1911/1915/1917 synthase
MTPNAINVIYEDESVLVINKPAGLMVHGDGRSTEPTLADWMVETYPDIRDVGESWENQEGQIIYRPGIVHRLDRDTSGVMVIAKTQEAFEQLKEQFQNRLVQKMYHAVVYGNIIEDEGEIDKPIGKSKNDFRQWSAQPGARGTLREAHSIYRVLARSVDRQYCYVEVSPKTGRTHQIRVHMKAIHHPVVCDALYAAGRECTLGFKRLALHAHTLTLQLPDRGQMSFTAPLPSDFEKVANEWGVMGAR